MFASIYQYYWREKTRRTEDFSMKETPSYYREYIEETHKVIREDEQGKEPSDVVREVERHFCAKEEKERRDGTSRSHPPRRVRDGDSGEGANGG